MRQGNKTRPLFGTAGLIERCLGDTHLQGSPTSLYARRFLKIRKAVRRPLRPPRLSNQNKARPPGGRLG